MYKERTLQIKDVEASFIAHLPLGIQQMQQAPLNEVVGWQHFGVHLVRPLLLERFHQATDQSVITHTHAFFLL